MTGTAGHASAPAGSGAPGRSTSSAQIPTSARSIARAIAAELKTGGATPTAASGASHPPVESLLGGLDDVLTAGQLSNPALAEPALSAIQRADGPALERAVQALAAERARHHLMPIVIVDIVLPGLWRGQVALADLRELERRATARLGPFPTTAAPAPAPPPPGVTWEIAVGGVAQAGAAHAKVGDEIVVRAHLSRPASGPIAAARSTGQGLALRGERPLGAQVHEFHLVGTAVGPGVLHAVLDVDGAVIEHDLAVQILALDRREWLDRSIAATTHVLAGYLKASAFMQAIAQAYGHAWQGHAGALRAADAAMQAREHALMAAREADLNMLLGALFALIPGGMGGMVGGALKSAKSSDFLVDGVKDLFKWGLRTASAAGVALVHGTPHASDVHGSFTPMPENPTDWEAQMSIRVTAEQATVASTLASWQDRVNRNDPTFALDFDPVTEVSKLKLEGVLLESLVAPDVAATAKAIEIGMWRDWLERNSWATATTIRDSDGDDGSLWGIITGDFPHEVTDAVNQVPEEVAARCRELGIDVSAASARAHDRAIGQAVDANRQRLRR
ncbi:MAG: hypothetical protein K8W52_43490 [Deltaproteobacteria bacterium]|nr:hypothetical protein [Deltaproteobacteria bacterium]